MTCAHYIDFWRRTCVYCGEFEPRRCLVKAKIILEPIYRRYAAEPPALVVESPEGSQAIGALPYRDCVELEIDGRRTRVDASELIEAVNAARSRG